MNDPTQEFMLEARRRFVSAHDLKVWLRTPHHALGGATPEYVMIVRRDIMRVVAIMHAERTGPRFTMVSPEPGVEYVDVRLDE